MQRKLFVVLVLTALLPALLFASGKIRGKVADAGTGEPLVGANVVVVGSSMGAATNVAGEYTILNVPAGTYTLKTSYVGYQSITISNIRVNNDLTTETNFQLPAEGVTVGTVEIIAERPMINKSATNTARIIDNEFFAKIPARGTGAAIAVQPGVVVQRGVVYIRGGRADEVGFKVEGVGVNDVLNGGQKLGITAEAVEQIQVQAGGFNAEYGGANAGLVQTQLRTGSADRWRVTLLGETDRYTSMGKKTLGGYSYGYSDFTGTFGGPIPGTGNKVRFFGSAQNTFFRDPTVSVRAPYDFTGANAVVADPVATPAHPGASASDTLQLSLGPNAVGGMNNAWTTMGTLLFDFGVVQLRAAGSYTKTTSRNTTNLANLFNQSRLPLNYAENGFGNLRISHVITPTTFYEVNVNYYATRDESMDPELGTDLFAYGDPAANAALGYSLRDTSLNWSSYQLWGGAYGVNQAGTQIAGYNKLLTKSLGGRLDFTTQRGQHEIKFGGEYTQYTIRNYAPSGVFSWFGQREDARTRGYSADQLEVILMTIGGTGSNTYGYDVYGNELDADVVKNNALWYLGPRKPVFAAAYLQDKIEYADIILNVGLRWDYIDPSSKDVDNPSNLEFSSDNLFISSFVKETAKTSAISPRIGFSFPVTDRTVFHAQYGKFIQQTKLRDSYLAAATMAGVIKNGFFVTGTWGWGLKPTRTTQYEVGLSQQISDFASFDINAFFKDIQDQITWANVAPDPGTAGQNYGALLNADYATSKGIEIKFTLRRTNRISAQVNYTFADTKTTGSNTASTAGLWSAGSIVSLPKYAFPADFNQAHRGSALLDYRFGKDEGGPILSQLGANFLLQFNSGHNFTRLVASQRGSAPTDPRFRTPVEPIGASTTPWFFQLDARLDKTFPIGPMDLNLYVYVINLLGTDNPIDAFFRTGDPKDDGWFSSSEGKKDALAHGAQYVDFYRALSLGENSGNFGAPRQIRFGVRLDY